MRTDGVSRSGSHIQGLISSNRNTPMVLYQTARLRQIPRCRTWRPSERQCSKCCSTIADNARPRPDVVNSTVVLAQKSIGSRSPFIRKQSNPPAATLDGPLVLCAPRPKRLETRFLPVSGSKRASSYVVQSRATMTLSQPQVRPIVSISRFSEPGWKASSCSTTRKRSPSRLTHLPVG